MQKVWINLSDICSEQHRSRAHKTCLRHLRIVFKLSYLDKTYLRCLQENLTENNCQHTHKCLEKISNRRLKNISTSDVSNTSFKNVFKTDFLFTFIYLFFALSSKCCVLIFGHKSNGVTKSL